MRTVTLVGCIGLALVGCRSSSNNNVDSGGGDDGGGGFVTIYQIQNDSMPPGTPVSVQGVVVTAIDTFGGKTGDMWIEDPKGGPFSGVHVYNAPTTSVAALSVGDVVTITGAQKTEFALTGSNADPTGRTDTEIEPVTGGQMTVTKTSTGTVPAPAVVDALMIGQMSDADAQGPNFTAAWEQWEGVLITLNNVSALSAPKSFGSTMPPPADNYEFGITGVAEVEGTLADITMSGVARNTCFTSVTGVVDYFYNYLVLPRMSSEMVVASDTSGCPQPETVCNDGIDNDGNGYNDCGATKADDNCIISDSTCRSTATIGALDAKYDANPAAPDFTGILPADNGVEIDDACVVAVTGGTTPKNMYVAASGTAAADGGIYIYGQGQPLPTGVAKGKLVSVVGTTSNFKASGSTSTNVQLEIPQLQVTLGTGSCTPAPKLFTSAATLTTDATGHPYIGSYVTLTTAMTVGTATTATNHFGTLVAGSITFAVDDELSSISGSTSGTAFSSVTGIWTWDTQANSKAGGYEIVLTQAPTP